MSLQVGRNSCWMKNFCLEHRFGINGHDIFPETACRPEHAKQVGPQNSFVLASQDIFKILFGQSIMCCRFEDDKTITVTYRRKKICM